MPQLSKRKKPRLIDLPPPGRHGVVSKAPATIADPMQVTIEGFDDRYAYEIDRWQSRGATIPAVGDEVLVLLDDAGEPWVPAWWPAGGDVQSTGEWQPIALDGTWANFGFGFAPAQARLELGGQVVRIQGVVVPGATGLVGTLPVGLRPSVSHIIAVPYNGGGAVYAILGTDGTITLNAISAGWFSLNATVST